MQPAFDQPGCQLRRAVLPVGELADVGRCYHDERGVAAEGLLQAHPVQLIAHIAGADRGRQVRPAVDARLEALDVMHGDVVREVNAAQRCLHAGMHEVCCQRAGRVHAALASPREHNVLDRPC